MTTLTVEVDKTTINHISKKHRDLSFLLTKKYLPLYLWMYIRFYILIIYIMNILKNTIIFILIFIWFINISYSFEYTKLELDNSKDKLLLIKNGYKYKKLIDIFIEKNKDNKANLNIVLFRIEKVLNNLESGIYGKTKIVYSMKQVLDYMHLLIYFRLEKLNIVDIIEDKKEEIEEEIKEKKEQINIQETSYKKLYPGFSTVYNDKQKAILAGESSYIYKQSFSSLYEATDVGTIIFYITGPDIYNIKNSIKTASLYLEGSIIDTVSVSKVDIISSTMAKITFNNLNDFIIFQKPRQIRLMIETPNIGYEKIGKIIKDLYVSKVGFDDIYGLSSGKKLNNYSVSNKPGELFSILPATLDITLNKNLSNNGPELNIKGLFGNNSNDADHGVPKIRLDKMRLSTLGSSTSTGVYYTISNSNDTMDDIVGVISNGYVEFDLMGMSISNKTISNTTNGEDFRIYIYGTDSSTNISLSLQSDGITYSVVGVSGADNLSIFFKKYIYLGVKNY